MRGIKKKIKIKKNEKKTEGRIEGVGVGMCRVDRRILIYLLLRD